MANRGSAKVTGISPSFLLLLHYMHSAVREAENFDAGICNIDVNVDNYICR